MTKVAEQYTIPKYFALYCKIYTNMYILEKYTKTIFTVPLKILLIGRLARSTSERALRVRTLAGDIVLCS